MPKSKKILFLSFALLLIANFLAWCIVWDLSRPNFLEITFFDVGQGDSIFVQTPQRQQILIDGGPSAQRILQRLSQVLPFWDRSLDLVVLTHPEKDHMRGLIAVLQRYKVDYVLWTGILRRTQTFQEWAAALADEVGEGGSGSIIKIARAGQTIALSGSYPDSAGVSLEILHPFKSLVGRGEGEFPSINDTSIVAQLTHGNTSFFFTGDITKKVEQQLLQRNLTFSTGVEKVKSGVLKVAHHGSKTSSAPEFIEVVSPEIAVISCGKDNPYGHPHPDVLATLAKYDITILRTDRHGDIKILSDGKNVWYTQKKKKQ